MDPVELERLVGDRLEQLPARRAPATLLPRVMAAVRAAALPWYRREWFAWPAAWQTLSAAALVSLVIAIGWLLPEVFMRVDTGLGEALHPVAAPVRDVVGWIEAAATAARVMWEVVQPVAAVVALLVLMMCAACLAFATALGHIAFGGTLRP